MVIKKVSLINQVLLIILLGFVGGVLVMYSLPPVCIDRIDVKFIFDRQAIFNSTEDNCHDCLIINGTLESCDPENDMTCLLMLTNRSKVYLFGDDHELKPWKSGDLINLKWCRIDGKHFIKGAELSDG